VGELRNDVSALSARPSCSRGKFVRRICLSDLISVAKLRLSGLGDRLTGRRSWSATFPRDAAAQGCGPPGRTSHLIVSLQRAVSNCVSGVWDVPPFQRGFVWSPAMVRDLAESLWRGYPIGPILLWRNPRGPGPSSGEPLWIVDGQQRLTALCSLFGSAPHWQRSQQATAREKLSERCVVVDPLAPVSVMLYLAGADSCWSGAIGVPLSAILGPVASADDGREAVERLSEQIALATGITPAQRKTVVHRLLHLCQIRHQPLVVTIVEHEQADVLEMFERLSGGGLRFRRIVLRVLAQAIRARWPRAGGRSS
jgi:hypothetical protein